MVKKYHIIITILLLFLPLKSISFEKASVNNKIIRNNINILYVLHSNSIFEAVLHLPELKKNITSNMAIAENFYYSEIDSNKLKLYTQDLEVIFSNIPKEISTKHFLQINKWCRIKHDLSILPLDEESLMERAFELELTKPLLIMS